MRWKHATRCTYLSSMRYRSPSLSMQFPLNSKLVMFMRTDCWSPDWNHFPVHALGKLHWPAKRTIINTFSRIRGNLCTRFNIRYVVYLSTARAYILRWFMDTSGYKIGQHRKQLFDCVANFVKSVSTRDTMYDYSERSNFHLSFCIDKSFRCSFFFSPAAR